MRLDLGAQLLQVLDNGHVDRLGQVGVVIGNVARLFADLEKDVLDTTCSKSTSQSPPVGYRHRLRTIAQELVASYK